jgi:predicted extracellular nuclease
MSTTAYNKRLDKASQIIRGVQRYPDVIGVEEMENLSTLQAVAAKVNADAVSMDALPNPNYVAYLVEGNDIGGIDVGFLVKESRITTVDVTQVELAGCDHVTPSTCNNYTNPNDGTLDILNDRPPLVLRATAPRPSGGTLAFTVIVNHMRSLSGIDDTTCKAPARSARACARSARTAPSFSLITFSRVKQ